jgi:hypothetical protein
MVRYKLVNAKDGNISETLESEDRLDAALEALEKLGWTIVIEGKPDLDFSTDDDNKDDAEGNDLSKLLGDD